MLTEEIRFFEDNFETLSQEFSGKAVLIKDQKVVDSFPTEIEAYNEGVRRFGNVEFLVRTVDGEKQQVAMPALTFGLINAKLHT